MEFKVTDRATPELDDVVSRVRQGSREAFAEIVDLYQDDVRTFVRWQVGNRAAADDVAQDVFVEAFRNIATFRGQGTIRSWLLGIARYRVLSHLRRKSKREGTSLDDSLAELHLSYVEDDPVDAEQRLEQLHALQDCVSSLPKDRQLIIEQYYFNSVPVAVIGRQMDRKPGSVRMMLLRIRDILRQCVERKTVSEF